MVNVYSSKELDPQKRAAGDLEIVIEDEIAQERPDEELASVESEKNADRVTAQYERTAARLLILTTNPTALVPDTDLSSRLLDIATLFAEVHVVILTNVKKGAYEAVRPLDNLWMYPTNSKHSMASISDAKQIISEQFEFAGGFRADIIVALDAFESGFTAVQVAKKYNRPLQVHITNDIFDPLYLKNQSNTFLKKFYTWYVFRQKPSVRVATRAIAKSLLEAHSELEPRLEIVPQHMDLAHIVNTEATGVLSARFPQYTFYILFVGSLTHESGAFEALAASAYLLQYPTISLIFLGEGAVRKELEEKALAMGVAEQVIISPKDIEVVSAMKEAHMLFFPDGKDADERVLLEAAAAGLPIVTTASDFVNELFTDGESAFICPPGDIQCLQEKSNILLNQNTYRRKLARTAREDVLARVEQNVDEYKLAFKNSVERVLYDFETPAADEVVIQEQQLGERPQ